MAFTGIYGGYTERDAQNRAQETQGLAQLQAAQGIVAKMQEQKDRSRLSELVAQSNGDPKAAMQALISAGTPQSLELAAKLHSLIPDPSQAALRQAQTIKAQVEAAQAATKMQAGSRLADLYNPQNAQEYTQGLSAPPQMYQSPDAARAAAIQADQAGLPVNTVAPNQGKLQSLLAQADPTAFVRGQVTAMNRPPERPQVIPAGAGLRLPGEKVPSYTQPTAPRVDPLVVVLGEDGKPVYAPRSKAEGMPAATAAGVPAPERSSEALRDDVFYQIINGKPRPGSIPTGRNGEGNAYRAQFANEQRKIANELGLSPEDLAVKATENKLKFAALGNVEKDLAAIRPYNDMLHGNGDIAIQLAQKAIATDARIANRPINWLKQNLTDNPDVAEFLAQAQIVSTEAARVLNNPRLVGQLTDSARHEMQGIINGDMPLESFTRVIKRMQSDGDRRVSAMEDQRKRTISEIRGKAGSPVNDAPQIPEFATEADAAKAGLKPGTKIKIGGRPGVWQ